MQVSSSGHPKGDEGPKIASLERATMLLLLSSIASLCVLQVFGVNVSNTQLWLSLENQGSFVKFTVSSRHFSTKYEQCDVIEANFNSLLHFFWNSEYMKHPDLRLR